MPHHVEVFLEDSPAAAGRWGWQCFTPPCRDETTGYDTLAAAEKAAAEHAAQET